MRLSELGITDNLLWFLISLFLVWWLGQQLFHAVTTLEILNLRVTNMVAFDKSPFWFVFVLIFKTLAWAISAYVLFKYPVSKFRKKPHR